MEWQYISSIGSCRQHQQWWKLQVELVYGSYFNPSRNRWTSFFCATRQQCLLQKTDPYRATILLARIYSRLDEESLNAYVTHHRENTKWIPLMITNIVIHLYYLGVPMGSGALPRYIKGHNCIVGLDKDRHGTPYEDKLCGLRCLAFHHSLKDTWDGFRGLETRTKVLKQQWEYHGLDLLHLPQFEECFNINVDIYSLCEDGAVIPRYFSEEVHQDKMVLNLYDTHLSYVTNVPAYLQKYHCDCCGRNFRQLIDWKRHQGCCANATEYEFPGGFHKMSPSIFDRLDRLIQHHSPFWGTSLSLVHCLWFWSHTVPCYQRTSHPTSQMAEKTLTYLGQCGFQCGWIWRSQMFRELRS